MAKGGPKLEEAVPDPPTPVTVSKTSEAVRANQSAAADAASSNPAPANGGERSFAGRERGTVSRTAGGITINSGGFRRTVNQKGQVQFEYDSLTMERFASLLSQYLDRPVVDQTGLEGNYQVSYGIDVKAMAMAVMNDRLMSIGKPTEMADPIADPGEAIFTSVKKLGLKLDSRVLPCDVLVIDHIEKAPTEN